MLPLCALVMYSIMKCRAVKRRCLCCQLSSVWHQQRLALIAKNIDESILFVKCKRMLDGLLPWVVHRLERLGFFSICCFGIDKWRRCVSLHFLISICLIVQLIHARYGGCSETLLKRLQQLNGSSDCDDGYCPATISRRSLRGSARQQFAVITPFKTSHLDSGVSAIKSSSRHRIL